MKNKKANIEMTKRDTFEAENLGNFSMLYSSENKAMYKEFILEADRLW